MEGMVLMVAQQWRGEWPPLLCCSGSVMREEKLEKLLRTGLRTENRGNTFAIVQSASAQHSVCKPVGTLEIVLNIHLQYEETNGRNLTLWDKLAPLTCVTSPGHGVGWSRRA